MKPTNSALELQVQQMGIENEKQSSHATVSIQNISKVRINKFF